MIRKTVPLPVIPKRGIGHRTCIYRHLLIVIGQVNKRFRIIFLYKLLTLKKREQEPGQGQDSLEAVLLGTS